VSNHSRVARPLVVALALTVPSGAGAQASDSTAGGAAPLTDRLGRWGVEAWAAYSSRSTDMGVLGNMPGQRLALVAARLTRRLAASRGATLDYTLDVLPVARLSPPLKNNVARRPVCAVDVPCEVSAAERVVLGAASGTATGAGIAPLGLAVVFRPASALQLRVGATGGVLWFDRAVPTTSARRLNATGAVEAGAQLVGRRGHGVLLAYRFHHLSNAGTAADNPGLGSHMLSLGARWRLGRR
jgi:hypothetical protein